MIRRYVGKATGARRRSKRRGFYPWPFWSLPTLFIATGAMTALLVVVLIVNPGSDIPSEAKGTQPSAGVTPTTTTHPPVSKPAGSSSAPAVEHKTKPIQSVPSESATSPKATPSPSPSHSSPKPKPTHSTTPPPPPDPEIYTFVVRDELKTVCDKHAGEDNVLGTGTRYWSLVNDNNPDHALAYHEATTIPSWHVDCSVIPLLDTIVVP